MSKGPGHPMLSLGLGKFAHEELYLIQEALSDMMVMFSPLPLQM